MTIPRLLIAAALLVLAVGYGSFHLGWHAAEYAATIPPDAQVTHLTACLSATPPNDCPKLILR